MSHQDVFFLLVGAVMVFAMHAGFAFLELGTVRKKNQVNALAKILMDFCISTIAYFFVGYQIAYGIGFSESAVVLSADHGFKLIKFFFLLTFAAAVPAIISGGIAERSKFSSQLIAGFLLVAFAYPVLEGIVWNRAWNIQDNFLRLFGADFHDFAGSIVVHAFGGWVALPAILLLGPRQGRYAKNGQLHAFPPSSIPFLAIGAWVLTVGWFGFNVMSAQNMTAISGLVAVNSLMALVGGTLSSFIVGKNDAVFIYNGALAGLVAVCAGSDVMHPVGALLTGVIAGGLFVWTFTLAQKNWKIDDVLGVWPLHGLCGTWGGIATGIFGQSMLGGRGGVSIFSQLFGTLLSVTFAVIMGALIYGSLKVFCGIRVGKEEEYSGADISVHKISSTFSGGLEE